MFSALEDGHVDAVMTPIEADTHSDEGVRERLQALGWFYTNLTHSPKAVLDERAKLAWEHFKEETGKTDDASAVAELRRLVKETIVSGGKLPAKGEQTKLRVPGTWCVTVADGIGNAAWGKDFGGLFEEENDIYMNNMSIGRIPIMAKLEAKFRRKFKPAGGVTLHFQFVEPDPIPAGHALAAEPLRTTGITTKADMASRSLSDVTLTRTGNPDQYVKGVRDDHPPLAGDPFVDNVHMSRGGKRGLGRVTGIMPSETLLELGTRPWFHTELGLGNLLGSSHANAGKVVTNDKGEAVAIFMPFGARG